MEVFLIRHGEMEYEPGAVTDLELVNAYATGAREGPLTARGREQANCVAEFLAACGPAALYSSTFIRARQTAEATSRRLGLPVQVRAELGEINVGRLDPKRDRLQAAVLGGIGGLRKLLPQLAGEKTGAALVEYLFIVFYYRSWHGGKTLDAESMQDALGRIRGAYEQVSRSHPDSERVAVFTHGYFIHLLVNHILDRKGAPRRMLRKPYIHHGSITRVARASSGRWQVKDYADTRHIRLNNS